MSEPTTDEQQQNHNIRYLPLVYSLPQELIARCPTLSQLPRNLSVLSASDSLLDLIETDTFLHEIMDASAALAFPYFGFGGWKEHYTGDFPVWRLSYAMPLWLKGIERAIGWGWEALLHFPPGEEIPFFSSEYIATIYERVVKRTIVEQRWQPLLDIVREMPCHEDFEGWNTRVRIDFLRKWYHTRVKNVRTFSLESSLEDGDGKLYYIPDETQNVEETVIAQDYSERFFARLSERDQAILQLRLDGFTHVQIAEKLGYANHSGVIKRMQAIRKKFEQYQNEQEPYSQ